MTKKKIPTTAILDGDIIAYKAAFWADTEGVDGLDYRLPEDIEKWTPEGIDTIIIAFSCNRKDNFRRDHLADYKKKRDSSDRPDTLQECKDYMSDRWDIILEPRLEADDLIGIYTSSEEMVGVTIDKDLKTIPGFHWNPDKDDAIRYLTEEEADKFLFIQWMAGDSTDSIPGLWRIGPKRADKFLNKWEKETWVQMIFDMYDDPKYYRDSIPNLALAMARSVRILRSGEYNFKTKEINLWMPDSWV